MFLCALLPQMGRVVFWVRGSVAQDRTPLRGTQWTAWNREVSSLARARHRFISERWLQGIVHLSGESHLIRPILHGRLDARHVRRFWSTPLFVPNFLLNHLLFAWLHSELDLGLAWKAKKKFFGIHGDKWCVNGH